MKLRIVIPVYNREHCLHRAIESVLKQSYSNFTLYIVDDCSTDQSLSVAVSYQEKYPDKIRWISLDKNRGVSAARNRALQEIKEDAIAFLDSDDEWLPKKLELQVQRMQETGANLVHTEEIWVRNDVRVNAMNKHKKAGGYILEQCLDMCRISPSSVLIKKEVFEEIGLFNEDYPVCEDYDLWLRICAKYPVEFIEEALLVKYGGHDDQLSRKFHSMDYWRVKSLDNLLKDQQLPADLRNKAIQVLLKKCRILLKGYERHNNLVHYEEVLSLSEEYSKAL